MQSAAIREYRQCRTVQHQKMSAQREYGQLISVQECRNFGQPTFVPKSGLLHPNDRR